MGIGAIKAIGEVICLVLASVVIPSPIPTGGSWEVTEEWVVRYDGPWDIDAPEDMVVDPLGNAYVTGRSRINETGFDVTTVAYDTDGNERWVARYDGPFSGYDGGNAIAMGPGGNIFVIGVSEGNGTDSDMITLAYDSSGNELWVARYDASGKHDAGAAIDVNSKGNVFVTGSSRLGEPGVFYNDYTTIAYDSSGNELWVSHYNNYGYDYAMAIAANPEGFVYVTGRSQSSDERDVHYATVAYDSIGSTMWVARYDNSPEERGNGAIALTLDSGGNIYVTGKGWGNDATKVDIATIAYDSTGSELWVKRYNGPDSSADHARSIALGPEGHVYVTGDIWDGKGSLNETVVAYDSTGNELWTRSFPDRGSMNYGTPKALAVDDVGNVYVMGDDFITVAYDSTGNELWTAIYDNPSGLYCLTRAIELDAAGNVYVTGYCNIDHNDVDYVTVKYSQKWTPKVEVDIDPDTLNLDSKGRWITAYIGISGGFGLKLIDVSTILLNGTIPAEMWPTEIGDHDGDGVPELMVKFNRTAVREGP
jgi:hypothetical protein